MVKLAVFTGSRSDFDRLYWVCRTIEEKQDAELALILGYLHFSASLGESFRAVVDSGLPIAKEIRLEVDDLRDNDVASLVGEATRILGQSLADIQPDALIVLGARLEILAAVSAATCLGIPIAHIGGGQITEGSVDDSVRHAVTKLSHLHFVANSNAERRVLQLGEESWRVHLTGSPSIDAVIGSEFPDAKSLGTDIGLDFSKPVALITVHPETLSSEQEQAIFNREVFGALLKTDFQLLFTYPNGDPGSDAILNEIQIMVENDGKRCVAVPNLSRARYASALRHSRLMIGNSSSGVVEAPAFNLPVVNIGKRQDGRLKAKNVYSCVPLENEIDKAINWAMNYQTDSCDKPYGDGQSAPRIVEALVEIVGKTSCKVLLSKKFCHPYLED